ncbi:MAG: type II toxin-antitoxin system prevent-host-death family antitoxin [Candidatus Acidiferrales bacterium]
MVTVKALEARVRFSDLLNRVARGEEITITRYGAPVALLVPVDVKKSNIAHMEIVKGMRALRKRVKPGRESIREMVAEGHRF